MPPWGAETMSGMPSPLKSPTATIGSASAPPPDGSGIGTFKKPVPAPRRSVAVPSSEFALLVSRKRDCARRRNRAFGPNARCECIHIRRVRPSNRGDGERRLQPRRPRANRQPDGGRGARSAGQSAEEYSLIAVASRAGTEAQHRGSGAGQLRCAQEMDVRAGGRSGIAEVHLSKRERRAPACTVAVKVTTVPPATEDTAFPPEVRERVVAVAWDAQAGWERHTKPGKRSRVHNKTNSAGPVPSAPRPFAESACRNLPVEADYPSA